MNLTFENIDLTDSLNVEYAISTLRAYAALPPALVRDMSSLTVNFGSINALANEGPSSYIAEPHDLGVYGKTTRTFLETMLGRIERDGKTTLEEVAAHMDVSLDTARAYLRNAGRTAAAHKVSLPVTPTWNHESGCNEYTVTKSAE
jgi:hypothetical protein